MLSVKQRGRAYRLEGEFLGVYLRLSLDTRNGSDAEKRLNMIKSAEREGNDSEKWKELRRLLPEPTFARLTQIAGYVEKPAAPPPPPTWSDLVRSFTTEVRHRIAIGKMRETTLARYQQTIIGFSDFLGENHIAALPEITKPTVEMFKAWRMAQILKRKQSRGGGRLALDAAILHRIFSHAVECELLAKNPVRLEGRPGDNPELGAQPFTSKDLERMREAAGADRLILLLLRHSGLRGSDAVSLRWREVDWSTREINRVTQKRSKRVIVPIHPELLFELEAERDRRHPSDEDRILLNPATRRPMSRPRLCARMIALGHRAEVPSAHPHRFRDTFAVDMLLKGAIPYEVAKLLDDTIETVEKHCAPFVKELRERSRRIMESGEGLEAGLENRSIFCTATAQK
jgi:integrase